MAPGLLQCWLRQEECGTSQSASSTKQCHALGHVTGLDNAVSHCRATVSQRYLPESAVQTPLSATDPLAVHLIFVQREVVTIQSAGKTEDCCVACNFVEEINSLLHLKGKNDKKEPCLSS